jgi:hypothetical protein
VVLPFHHGVLSRERVADRRIAGADSGDSEDTAGEREEEDGGRQEDTSSRFSRTIEIRAHGSPLLSR